MARSRDIYTTQYQTFTGKERYVVDVPDGDCQVEIDLRSSRPATVYLHTRPDGPGMVYATGHEVFGRFNVAGLLALSIETSKGSVVSYKVQHRLRKMADPLNDEIVSLPVPPPQIPLADLVSRAVGERLQELTGEKDPQVDLEELIDDLPSDVDEEFGRGAMEIDEDFGESWQKRAAKAPNKPPRGNSPPAGSPPNDTGVQQPVEPTKPTKQADPRLAEIERLLVALKADS